MKHFQIIFYLVIILQSCASRELVSPFNSSVEGLNIPNSHIISESPKVIRGMRPRSKQDIVELKSQGISEIINFRKSADKDESLEAEKSLLNKSDWNSKNFHHFDFPWKDISDFQEACRTTVAALVKIRQAKGGVFIHCTVGEDRTGLLSGLYRILAQGWTQQKAFDEEMCGHGFAESNPTKPPFVSEKVRESLTPLFESMAFEIEKQKLKLSNISEKLCEAPQMKKLQAEKFKSSRMCPKN